MRPYIKAQMRSAAETSRADAEAVGRTLARERGARSALESELRTMTESSRRDSDELNTFQKELKQKEQAGRGRDQALD